MNAPDVGAQIKIGQDLDAEGTDDNFGFSISLSANGNRLAAGGPRNNSSGLNSGHTRIFEWNGSKWELLGAEIPGINPGDFCGSVSLSSDGSRVAIGSAGNNSNGADSGHTRMFDWNGTQWILVGNALFGEAPFDRSGTTVALSGDGMRVAIGAPRNDPNGLNDAGHVRVYDWNGTVWIPVGVDINGTVPFQNFGGALGISKDGNRIIASGGLVNRREAYVFEWNGSNWVQIGSTLDLATDVAISADGNRVVLGDRTRNRVTVYEWNNTDWSILGNILFGEASGDLFGSSVGISANGDRIAAGAMLNNGRGASSGHARIFDWNGTQWEQVGFDIDGEALEDRSGSAIGISEDGLRVGIGADQNRKSCIRSGHVRVYQLQGDLCLAGGVDLANEKISRIEFNTIDNSSNSTESYEDFTTIKTIVEKGLSYSVTATISNPNVDDEIIIWIDLNFDSDFDDPGEEVYRSPTGVGPHAGLITIPSSALIGESRMRVRLNNSAAGPNESPCGNSDFGQVEDYSILITEGPGEVLAFKRGDYIQINNPNLPQGNAPRTIECWVKPLREAVNNYVSMIDYGTTSYNQRFALTIRPDRAFYFSGELNDLPTNRNIVDGCWHHCAVTHDGDEVKIYIDGFLETSSAKVLNTSGTIMEIGRRLSTDTELYGGFMEEVRV